MAHSTIEFDGLHRNRVGVAEFANTTIRNLIAERGAMPIARPGH